MFCFTRRERGEPGGGGHRGKGRGHSADHRVRRTLRVQRGATAEQGDDPDHGRARGGRRKRAPDDHCREDLRQAPGYRREQGNVRCPVGAGGRREFLPHRHPLQPRIRHPHGLDLFRGKGREGRQDRGPRHGPVLPRPPDVPVQGDEPGAHRGRIARRRQRAGGQGVSGPGGGLDSGHEQRHRRPGRRHRHSPARKRPRSRNARTQRVDHGRPYAARAALHDHDG